MNNLRICILIKYECYGKLINNYDKIVNKGQRLGWRTRLKYLSYVRVVSRKLSYRLKGGLWKI